MEFSDAPSEETRGLEIGPDQFAVLPLGAIECDEIDEVARRNGSVRVGLGGDALEIDTEFVQREFPGIAVIWHEALQDAERARFGAARSVFDRTRDWRHVRKPMLSQEATH